MRILFSNDDGFDSPLLHRMVRIAAARGHEVLVSAPKEQQSAKSQSMTFTGPLIVREADMPGAAKAWKVAGTPADCVRLALTALCRERPDAVVSGMNAGWNAGTDIFVSGTVGAARVGAFDNIPSAAVSAEPGTPEDMLEHFAAESIRLTEKLVSDGHPRLSVLNLNAPCMPLTALRGIRMADLSRTPWPDGYVLTQNPRGEMCYWAEDYHPELAPEPEEGSDRRLLREGYITATFLTVEDSLCQQDYQSFIES